MEARLDTPPLAAEPRGPPKIVASSVSSAVMLCAERTWWDNPGSSVIKRTLEGGVIPILVALFRSTSSKSISSNTSPRE